MLDNHKNSFKDAMDDDLNTALAISVLFEMVRDINSTITSENTKATIDLAQSTLLELGKVLGLLQVKQEKTLDDEIEQLIEKRQQARKDKNFALSDEIRDTLKLQGILLEDTPSGVKWRRG